MTKTKPPQLKCKKMDGVIRRVKHILSSPFYLTDEAPNNSILGTTQYLAKVQIEGDSRLRYQWLLRKNPELDHATQMELKRANHRKAFQQATESDITSIFMDTLQVLGKEFFDEKRLKRYEAEKKRLNNRRLKAFERFEQDFQKFEDQIIENPELLAELEPPKPPNDVIPEEATPFEYLSIVLKENGIKISLQYLEELTDDPQLKQTALKHLSNNFCLKVDEFKAVYPNIARKMETEGRLWEPRKKRVRRKK